MPAERRWADLTRRDRLALLRRGLTDTQPDAGKVDRIMGRVDEHFRGQRLDDPTEAVSVLLRESWREDHGNTDAWDAAAAGQAAEATS